MCTSFVTVLVFVTFVSRCLAASIRYINDNIPAFHVMPPNAILPLPGREFPIYPPVPHQPLWSPDLYLPQSPYEFGQFPGLQPLPPGYPQPPKGLENRPPLKKGLNYTTEETLKNDPTDQMDPSVHYTILKYMPTLPNDLADTLYNMEPGFVQYIIRGHQNLPQFLMAMDSMTLRYLLLHVPKLLNTVSKFEDAAVQNIFGKISDPCVYLSTLNQNVIETITAKVPFLKACKIPKEIDISKIGRIEAKLPAIMKFADPQKLSALQELHPNFSEKLSEMTRKYDAILNIDVEKVTAKDIKSILDFKAKTEPFFKQLAQLF